jgi:hypothetical protein
LKEGKVEVKLRSNLDETLSYDLKGLAVEMKGLIQSLTDAINERIVEPEWDKTAN